MAQNGNSTRLLNTLGMCRKARRLAVGSDAVLKAVRTGDAKIALISSDASDRTAKQITDKCAFYGVTVVRLSSDSYDVGRAVGGSAVAVCAVTDSSLASKAASLAAEEQISE